MLTKRTLLVVFCSLLSVCPSLYGQATGNFSGTITDKTGSVIPGATVTATSQGTSLARESKTDDSGHYLIPLLPVSNYTIRVNSQGFQPAEQKDVRLQIDEHRELNFTLAPASVTSTVEVNAEQVAVETTTPTLGQVITAEQVADLPLNGRNFVQLATLTPGTTASTSPVSFFNGAPSSEASTRGSFSLSVGGSREQSTDWMLDGNDNNQLDEGGIAIFSTIDDIQEFKVLTYNYSAEWGERAGPTVLVTTKSGTNQLHGSLFEYFRNTDLDARSYFATSTEKFNLNQFGGSLGGPIQKDKTFFFIDYQAKMQRRGIPFTGLVPTLAMMGGDFTDDPFGNPRGPSNANGFGNLTNPYATGAEAKNFQCVPGTLTPEPVAGDGSQPLGAVCNVIPAAIINPIGQKMVNLYPVGNASNAALDYNFVNEPVRKLNEGTADIRVDHNFNSKDSAFARFSYDQATNFVPGGSPGFAEANAFGSTQFITNHGRNAVVSETHVFSDRTINQVTAGFSRIFNHILSLGTGTCEATTLGIPGANLDSKCNAPGVPPGLNQSPKECMSCGLTSMELTNYWSIGDRGFAPYQGGTNVFSISDSFDMIRGKHDIRIGGAIRANQMNVRTNGFQDGFMTFTGGLTGDSMADLLLGMWNYAEHDQTFEGATTGRRWKLFRPYIQDDWRVTSNLTVNLGLAWALVTPVTESGNRQANFDWATKRFLVPAGSPGLTGCTNCVVSNSAVGIQFDKTALEPRIGFAWKPLSSDKTAVRGGYAIFHDSAWNQGGQGLWENPPFFNASEDGGFPGFNPCTTFGVPCGLSVGFGANSLVPFSTAPVAPSSYFGTIQSENLNFKQGMVQQFNLNIEHQLPGNVVLTAGYAGSRSTHILVSQLNENITSPSACGVVPGYTLGCGITTIPYPGPSGFGNIVSNNNDIGRSRYDSLQVKAETKSIRHGIYALIGYTWARNFDSGMPDGLGTNPGALYWPLPGSYKADWGLSQLNLNDTFTASILYQLPFGKGKKYGSNWSGATNAILGNWELDVIQRATSGFPLFVVDSADPAGTFFYYNGLTLDRPDQVGNPNQAGPIAGNPGCVAPAKIHTLENWFNPCAFVHAPAGELGDAARAPLYGPRFVNTDFSAIKNFPLPFREGMLLQFRAEFFNLFNHPQFFLSGVSDTGEQDINTSSNFGVVNQTVNNPRDIQFALRLKF
jgi:hypothetical protein